MSMPELERTHSATTAASAFWWSFVALSWFAPTPTSRAAIINEKQLPLVLIASADIFMRGALEFHLTRAGFRIEHASNGSEAVAKTTKQTAVVLLDLVMPDTHGFYCLREIRKSSPSTKIIGITRKRRAQDAVLCRKLGAYDSLSKPIDPHDVVEIVARAVNNEPVAPADFALSA
jgi:two-component system OmpR family response regulator